MDTPQAKSSPFPPADQVPLHRVAPLAPSQELAYRRKCIQLRRRLTEIEANNDATRRRIEQEKNHINKQRLNRAVLLERLKEMMDTPSRKLSKEELDKAAKANGGGKLAERLGSSKKRPAVTEYLLDDSTDETEDEEIPEPQERPTRFRRSNNAANRESNVAAPMSNSTGAYQQSALPNLAPAASFSPDLPREPAMLASSFRVSSTSSAPVQAPVQHQYPIQQPQQLAYPPQHAQPYSQVSMNDPQSQPQTLMQGPPPPSVGPAPVRPAPPFDQFNDHMVPQLEADHYPPDQITVRVRTEWQNLSQENRSLWEQRYHEQMIDYESEMDKYKRDSRRVQHIASGPISVNGTGPGGSFSGPVERNG